METLLFCEFDDQQFESISNFLCSAFNIISNFLCSAFNITRSELFDFYQSLKADFDLDDDAIANLRRLLHWPVTGRAATEVLFQILITGNGFGI